MSAHAEKLLVIGLDCAEPSLCPLRQKYDKRLLGTWRSDHRRTLREWRSKRRLTQKRRKRVADIFGHLTLRYTRRRVYWQFKDHRDVHEYKVLASDSDSVAILYWDFLLKQPSIQHIHFEGRHYWISLGWNREFFRKVGG